jgi:anti-sigma regulatory factor (Ser/Thr protein kinase)
VADALRPSHPSPLRDDAVLLVSEVVTNAVIHARTPLRLFLHDRPHLVRVEVEDASPDQPVTTTTTTSAPDALRASGRGLELVERLADAWGVESRRTGKVVWFELADVDGPVDDVRVPVYAG